MTVQKQRTLTVSRSAKRETACRYKRASSSIVKDYRKISDVHHTTLKGEMKTNGSVQKYKIKNSTNNSVISTKFEPHLTK
ncbi:hypothetical protein F6Y04_01740 [Bacillus megaterium]|nr:hypothetical protein [Priestia megaterium]